MSDPASVLIAATFVGGIVVTIRMIGGFVYRAKELELREKQGGYSLEDTRLQRIESAVEAIALEVERVSENQRYVTKLLSDRTSAGTALPRTDQPRA